MKQEVGLSPLHHYGCAGALWAPEPSGFRPVATPQVASEPSASRRRWRRSCRKFPLIPPPEPSTRRLPDPVWVPVEDLCEGLRFQPRLCYLSIYLAAGVKWLSDKLECNDNDRDS